MSESLNPSITVAAVIERDGRFLLVEERTSGGLVINQPAGHLEVNETLVDAVIRETLEETGYHFEPQSLLGVYQWRRQSRQKTVVRFAFAGRCPRHDHLRPLDQDIVRTLWLTPPELQQQRPRLRSPLVMRCIDDYLCGRRFPLEVLGGIVPEPVDGGHQLAAGPER